ncbi:MAG: insulinase family protein, partial [Rectinema sp.]
MPFVLQKETSVPELDSILRLYRHEPTGARLLSVINKDENKVFGVTFRTPPQRSDGVAHIIEHSVLCGSRKYPVKEPFVELMKGSLNTFLNAMTYPDKTCYPVASTNLKDFYNLIDVYLDAVFYPNLTKHTFMQEGWHYEVDPATK